MRENFQGPPITPLSVLFGEEDLDVEPSINALECCTNSLSHEDVEVQVHQHLKTDVLEEDYTHSHLDDTIPFLQMLQQNFELPLSTFASAQQPPHSFQKLLSLQHQKFPWQHLHPHPHPFHNYLPAMQKNPIPILGNTMEKESCLSHDVGNTMEQESCLSHDVVDVHHIPQSQASFETIKDAHLGTESADLRPAVRKKRKRATRRRDKEEVESQRITHIAVERNRRRLMNDHLHSLRSLMPPSYSQRGDQASIIGGAIDFVKELEQLLQSLQAQKRMRTISADGNYPITSNLQSPPLAQPPQEEEVELENRSGECQKWEAVVKVVAMMEKHVNLKVEFCGGKKEGQLVRAIVALEQLRLTVLHLNITTTSATSPATVHHYSFSLKMEDDCRLRTPDEIVGAVHQIFS